MLSAHIENENAGEDRPIIDSANIDIAYRGAVFSLETLLNLIIVGNNSRHMPLHLAVDEAIDHAAGEEEREEITQ